MGLTIHYNLHSKARTVKEARAAVHRLHQRAADLPFAELKDVIELKNELCDPDKYHHDQAMRWLLIQAKEFVTISSHRGEEQRELFPSHLIAFTAWPGEGCESADFGLCRYPRYFSLPGGVRVATKLPGWRWASFCKTQYASNPKYGGIQHFLRCHMSVIAMLDCARQLGVLERVSDEGEYWEKRDVKALALEVGEWNEMIASFVGGLKDTFGDGGAPILAFPNFEHLEARGRKETRDENLA